MKNQDENRLPKVKRVKMKKPLHIIVLYNVFFICKGLFLNPIHNLFLRIKYPTFRTELEVLWPDGLGFIEKSITDSGFYFKVTYDGSGGAIGSGDVVTMKIIIGAPSLPDVKRTLEKLQKNGHICKVVSLQRS